MGLALITSAGAVDFESISKLADKIKYEEIQVPEQKWQDALDYAYYSELGAPVRRRGAKWESIFNIDEARKLEEFDSKFVIKAFIVAELYKLFSSKLPVLKSNILGVDEINKVAGKIGDSMRVPDTLVTFKSSAVLVDSSVLHFRITRMRNDIGQLFYRGVVFCTHDAGWERMDYENLQISHSPWVKG